MYDRAQRIFDFNKVGSTSPNVGPGTYDAEAFHRTKHKSDGYAPFMSMTSRATCLELSSQVTAAPGPGHYDPVTLEPRVKGGSTIATRERRFKPHQTDTPGPGSYNTEMISAKSKPQIESGKLIMSRIKFHRNPEAPSIPTQNFAYGYEECEDGSLRKQEPPSKDQTIGPAFYNPTYTDTKATRQYRGVHFGKLTAKRVQIARRDGPGPADYEPYRDGQARMENANFHDDESPTRFEAHIPRFSEAVVKDTQKNNFPGPGKYDIRGQFDPNPPKVNTEGLEVEHPPFLSQAKRFSPVKNTVPAPGAYNDPRSALTALKKVTGLKRSPFGMTSVRFQQERRAKTTPGPGSYNTPGMGAESMRKAYLESTRKGVFGTTSMRTHTLMKREDLELPGPAHYQVKDKPFQQRYFQPTANFASVTNRLAEPPNVIKDIPPPGSYNVHKSYEKSQGRPDMAKPRTEAASHKHASFMTAASRFAYTRDGTQPIPDPDNPGPGAYDTIEYLQPKGGLMVTRDKRFRFKYDDIPGPGAYELSPLVQDSVLRGTFNATLNNPIAPHMSAVYALSTVNKHAFSLGV